jgi:hypothetical protein
MAIQVQGEHIVVDGATLNEILNKYRTQWQEAEAGGTCFEDLHEGLQDAIVVCSIVVQQQAQIEEMKGMLQAAAMDKLLSLFQEFVDGEEDGE